MQADDFVLFDDAPEGESYPQQAGTSGAVAPGFTKSSFLQHRGQFNDTSPLLEEAPYGHLGQLGQADPTLMQRALQGGGYAQQPLQESPHTHAGTSPTTPPPQPSSGTLGAPLTMLSLQGVNNDNNKALFPGTQPDSTNELQRDARQKPQGSDTPRWQQAKNENDTPFLWNPSTEQGNTNLTNWKQFWSNNQGQGVVPPMAANADVLRAANEASGRQAQSGDRTVSPRDLYLDQEESATPSARTDAGRGIAQTPYPTLFPERADDEPASMPTPFGLSSAMETGSSTEEEDDEDEKPFPSATYAGSVLGAMAPNEQLLEQWSRSMYAPVNQAAPNGRQPESMHNRQWPVTGPSFSAMSTSSESDDEPTMPPYTRGSHAGNATHFQASVPGALGGYGYIPSSQESGMSMQSPDSESMPGSHMSVSMTESDTPGNSGRNRSPSILNHAQAIVPASERHAPPSPSEDEDPAPAPRRARSPDTSRPRQLRSSSNSRRQETDATRNAREASLSGAAPPSSESSDPENDESDYEQSQHLSHPTPRASARRGRQTRSTSGHRATGSTGNVQSPPPGAYSGVLAGAARNAQATNSPNSSAIRCDYVFPVTGQTCGTIFHRMYDLARHRITLHLREEAQLVKDGMLNVDQCVVLGKEVDVQKALAELEWTCRVCGATFSRKDAMLRHERLRHHR